MLHRRGLPAALVAAFCILLLHLFLPASEALTAGRLQSTPDPHNLQTATPPPPTPAGSMPTPDRLAPPPTVQNPSQADEGAQIYWLNCQPCHGDVGQGLTDDWREQYPEDHQNCWTSGCHGDQPYENGFTLPTTVPPVTGEESLEKFDHMGLVYSYMSAAMPYNAPGSLDEEEYLAVTAFLAREHEVWDGQPLRPDDVSRLSLRSAPASSPTAAAPAGAADNSARATDDASGQSPSWFFLAILSLGGLVLLIWLWRRRQGF